MAPLVVIAGAGPAGLAAAAAFAQRGFDVEVHEKRAVAPDPTKDHAHSFTIVLNQKGLTALQSAGLDTSRLFPLLACLRHSPNGKQQQAMIEPKPGTVLAFERSELTLSLYQAVKKNHPNVKFVFNSACQGLDLQNKRVIVGPPPVEGQTNKTRAIKYDLLVAADGAHSAVRNALCEALPEQFQCSIRKAPLVYKRFKHLPCGESLNGKYGPDGCVLHFFGVRLPNTPPASTAAPGPADGVSASSATNGSTPAANATATTTTTATTEVKRANWGFLTVINDEQGRLSGGLSLFTKDQDLLKTPEEYEECLRLVPLPSETKRVLSQQLAAASWTWAGSWVRCSQLHAPGGVLVVGDAAHAVSPSMGQGCNAALEDITVLQRLMDERDFIVPSGKGSKGGAGAAPALDYDGLAAEFTKRRLEDVLALVWMDENARAFRGQMGLLNYHFMMYMAHMYVRSTLHRLAPGLVSKPALQVVWDTIVPYTDIAQQLRSDGRTLAITATAGATVCVAAAAAWLLRARR